MRYTQEQKDGTRQRIVRAASRAFRERGVEGASVSEIMASAGLTVGGFYRHFDSKEDLFREALSAAMTETLGLLRRRREDGETADGATWLRWAAGVYLTPEHRAHHAAGCPLPGLTAEVVRRDVATRQSFESALEGIVGEVTERLENHDPRARATAWGFLSTLVGSLLLARGVESDALADEILEAGRRAAAGGNG